MTQIPPLLQVYTIFFAHFIIQQANRRLFRNYFELSDTATCAQGLNIQYRDSLPEWLIFLLIRTSTHTMTFLHNWPSPYHQHAANSHYATASQNTPSSLQKSSCAVLNSPPLFFAIISKILQEKLKHKTGFSRALEWYSIRETHWKPVRFQSIFPIRLCSKIKLHPDAVRL